MAIGSRPRGFGVNQSMAVGLSTQTRTWLGGAWTHVNAGVADTLRAWGPALLFGFRLWASVCLALFVAYYLELANASWAGTSAAIVCQPQLGASLRKGWFRLIGTLIGAVVIVALTGAFPQDRVAFLGLLALWGAICAYFATQLRNFASYAAALAGYTAVIIAADTLGATGGPDGDVFMVAVTRASEISIGIISAGIVLAGTDLGTARRQLAKSIADLAAEITSGFMDMLELERTRSELRDTLSQRREHVRHIIALEPVIDQAIGESSELRYHSPILQGAFRGLFAASDGWRTIASHLPNLHGDDAQQQSAQILSAIPANLRAVLSSGDPERWMVDPVRLIGECEAARRSLRALPISTPSLRLLADQTARILSGVTRILDGLALLLDAPGRRLRGDRKFRLSVADWLPAMVNAARAFIVIGAAALFWIITAWPSGALTMTFVSIAVLLLSPRGDHAPEGALAFAIGTTLAIPFAATAKFAILPSYETFFAFCLVLGLYFVPVGIGVAQTRWPAVAGICTVMGLIFVPLLDPENQITYNTLEFYNSALAIFAGCAVASLSFYLLPPLPPSFRARRLLNAELRGLRRFACSSNPPTLEDWEQRTFSRLAALPDKASPQQRTQLLATLSVGTEIIKLRAMTSDLDLEPELDAALAGLAVGRSALAAARFEQLDRRLQTVSGSTAQLALRARASILAITEAIRQHAAFFDFGASS